MSASDRGVKRKLDAMQAETVPEEPTAPATQSPSREPTVGGSAETKDGTGPAETGAGATGKAEEATNGTVQDEDTQEEKLLQAKLDRELEVAMAERKAIEDGTDIRLLQDVKAFEARKASSVRTAEAFAEWRISAVKAQLEYERAAAEEICRAARENAVKSYLAEVDSRIRRVKDRKEAKPAHTSRSLRSKKSSTRTEKLVPFSINRPFTQTLDPPLKNAIADDDCLSDLKTIHNDWLSQAKKFRRTATAGLASQVRLERGRLHCDGDTFERGELVVVTSNITGQLFYGSITSLGSIEIGVRLSDGTRSRVPITMLQQGRCTMKHQPVGPPQ